LGLTPFQKEAPPEWETEFYLRRYLSMTTGDLEDMPVAKINLFVKLLNKEFDEMKKSLQT